MVRSNAFGKQGGALMIEVLISIAIVIIGLAGLMQMQFALQKSEIESYQRTQAIMLLNDMSSRIQSNRPNAEDYITTGLGTKFLGGLASEIDCDGIGTGTLQERDFEDWCNALQGAGETTGGSNVGAMIGGRGCVEQIGPAANGVFMVTVVWQGLVPISAPPANVTCGFKAAPDNPYDGDVTAVPAPPCINDLCRRYVTAMIRVKDLPVL
jgi:type IV pilus assembly protein PilV